MLTAHVAIRSISRNHKKIVDGTTEKTVVFEIEYPPNRWKFEHIVTDASREFDEQIALLEANGGTNVNADEFPRDKPTTDWADAVVRRALVKAGRISWEDGKQY